MTREEALQILDTIPTIGEQVDALEMAIKALEQEPCEDAISRKAVLDAISRIGLYKSGTKEVQAVAECLRAVEALPPVTPQPKTGHWIYENVLYSRCSECGELAIIANWSKVLSDFCPNCGAKMQESEE